MRPIFTIHAGEYLVGSKLGMLYDTKKAWVYFDLTLYLNNWKQIC